MLGQLNDPLKSSASYQAATKLKACARHGSLARANASIGGGLTLMPHMCTCYKVIGARFGAPVIISFVTVERITVSGSGGLFSVGMERPMPGHAQA